MSFKRNKNQDIPEIGPFLPQETSTPIPNNNAANHRHRDKPPPPIDSIRSDPNATNYFENFKKRANEAPHPGNDFYNRFLSSKNGDGTLKNAQHPRSVDTLAFGINPVPPRGVTATKSSEGQTNYLLT